MAEPDATKAEQINPQVFEILIAELNGIRKHEISVRSGWRSALLFQLPTFSFIELLRGGSMTLLFTLLSLVILTTFLADARRRIIVRRIYHYQDGLLRRLDANSRDTYISSAYDFKFAERYSSWASFVPQAEFWWLGAINCFSISACHFLHMPR